MAEFALGLTKTAVKETVSRVKSAIEEEANLRVRVQEDLVFITGEFEMMQSFLSASGVGERASRHQVVRTWVRQLRDLAFDVEDCVEFIIHLDKATRWDWVRRLASSVMVCTTRPPLPLDLAVAEIKRLKTRVEDVSQRNSRYNLMGEDHPSHHHHLHHHSITSSTHSSNGLTGALQVLVDVWKEAGKLTAIGLKKLVDSHVSELQVISLWRAGGGGDADVGDHAPPNKYALLLKQAYDDPQICAHFKNRAWVKLSALHPFDPVEFLNNLLTQFTYRHGKAADDDHHNHANSSNSTTSTISELLLQLSQLRYLIASSKN
uniref:Uncharacterized protein n=1 Tax=Avena sativa TaxID=4498 RepID=A0ACD5X458_AVESA